MYYFGYDPQTAKGHLCEICGCECFGDPICQKCARRIQDED